MLVVNINCFQVSRYNGSNASDFSSNSSSYGSPMGSVECSAGSTSTSPAYVGCSVHFSCVTMSFRVLEGSHLLKVGKTIITDVYSKFSYFLSLY